MILLFLPLVVIVVVAGRNVAPTILLSTNDATATVLKKFIRNEKNLPIFDDEENRDIELLVVNEIMRNENYIIGYFETLLNMLKYLKKPKVDQPLITVLPNGNELHIREHATIQTFISLMHLEESSFSLGTSLIRCDPMPYLVIIRLLTRHFSIRHYIISYGLENLCSLFIVQNILRYAKYETFQIELAPITQEEKSSNIDMILLHRMIKSIINNLHDDVVHAFKDLFWLHIYDDSEQLDILANIVHTIDNLLAKNVTDRSIRQKRSTKTIKEPFEDRSSPKSKITFHRPSKILSSLVQRTIHVDIIHVIMTSDIFYSTKDLNKLKNSGECLDIIRSDALAKLHFDQKNILLMKPNLDLCNQYRQMLMGYENYKTFIAFWRGELVLDWYRGATLLKKYYHNTLYDLFTAEDNFTVPVLQYNMVNDSLTIGKKISDLPGLNSLEVIDKKNQTVVYTSNRTQIVVLAVLLTFSVIFAVMVIYQCRVMRHNVIFYKSFLVEWNSIDLEGNVERNGNRERRVDSLDRKSFGEHNIHSIISMGNLLSNELDKDRRHSDVRLSDNDSKMSLFRQNAAIEKSGDVGSDKSESGRVEYQGDIWSNEPNGNNSNSNSLIEKLRRTSKIIGNRRFSFRTSFNENHNNNLGGKKSVPSRNDASNVTIISLMKGKNNKLFPETSSKHLAHHPSSSKGDQRNVVGPMSLSNMAPNKRSNDQNEFQNVHSTKLTGRLKSDKNKLVDLWPIIDLNHAPRTYRYNLLKDARMRKKINHKNLSSFVALTCDGEKIYQLVYSDRRGNLNSFLDGNRNGLNDRLRLSIAHDILRGLNYLHSSNIKFHGYLNTWNVIISDNLIAKLTGFSFKTSRTHDHVELEWDRLQQLVFCAPELLRFTHSICYDPKSLSIRKTIKVLQQCDVYSFGMICVSIASYETPFSETNIDWRDLPKYMFEQQDDVLILGSSFTQFKMPKVLLPVIRMCTSTLPADRPTCGALLRLVDQNMFSQDYGDIILSRISDYSKNVEQQVNKRLTEVEKQRECQRQLLYRLVPKSVATDLMHGIEYQPQQFKEVSVYFSDIVNFTNICSHSSAMEVITMLNEFFGVFDEIIEKFRVYKVETIGDAYVAVSDLTVDEQHEPKQTDYHAVEIGRMAIALRTALKEFRSHTKPDIELHIRAGIHSGPIVCGMPGKQRPHFCLFGDTLYVANLLESTSQADRINVSDEFRKILMKQQQIHKEHFICSLHKKIESRSENITAFWLDV
ncbi:hypothetical protein SNEBB_008554 [Seison nebaliae]|nr:hypothetical protein SNEBB_008554 [Seison nebaliae]